MQFLPVLVFFFVVFLSAVGKKKKAEQTRQKQAALSRQIAEALGETEAAPAPGISPLQTAPYPTRPVLPAKKPPRVPKKENKPAVPEAPAQEADMPYLSPEGTELHEDKAMHGTMHIAATRPAKTEDTPRYTAEQLKNAFIMKEILDAPLSRRENRRTAL